MRNQIRPSSFPLLLILIFFCLFNSTASKKQLNKGSSLAAEHGSDHLTSHNGTFTAGFYSMGTNAYWFAIWFTESSDRAIVWMANRDKPVNGKGSKVSLLRNGNMVLTDVDGSVAWETDTTSADDSTLELLETGNLVIKNSRGEFLWQSFDFPTDTLLPSQVFTKKNRLISGLRKGSFESGYFNMYFDSENVLRLIYDGPEISSIYWPNPDFDVYTNGRTNYNSTRIAFLDDFGSFHSSDRLQFNVSNFGIGIKRRMKLEYDGNLRVYSLSNSTGLWEITWQGIAQPCNVHGLCGRNAVCIYTPRPKCSCPPGHEVVNESDWNQGCRPRWNETHLSSMEVKFVEIPRTDFFGFDLNYSELISLNDCRDMCLNDFRCKAFGYRKTGKGLCFPKSELFNGYTSPDFPASIYLKVPLDFHETDTRQGFGIVCPDGEPEVLLGLPSMYNMAEKRVRWLYLYSFCVAVGAIEVVFFVLGWWVLFSKHGIPASIEEGYRVVSGQFRRFSHAELKKATRNFGEELGKGGSGAVYKGDLRDGRLVAVKRLGDVFQAEQEFWAEMSTIGRINHMNLVRLWGFCSEKRHRMLVYQYVENSSLDKWLFGSSFLDWNERLAVALGTAKGLAYLHHECLEWVIHCDIKPENILLDGELQPKIADFGLAKLLQRDGLGSKLTKIRGTKGYMAPEWASDHQITAKVDVYSFGVVVLEMVKGMRLSNWVVDDGHEHESSLRNFVRTVKWKIQAGEESWIDGIVDSRLNGKFDTKQAEILIGTGVSCVEEDRRKRPTMASVVQTLLECQD